MKTATPSFVTTQGTCGRFLCYHESPCVVGSIIYVTSYTYGNYVTNYYNYFTRNCIKLVR